MPEQNQEAIAKLRDIVAKLRAPDGCPWDRDQTHTTLRREMLEEAYEAVEAIDNNDLTHLREELGDVLLQVVMHSQIASEAGHFNFDEVTNAISEKLIRRHPHVFGDSKIANTEGVLKQWDEIKRAEKNHTGSILEGLSSGLPSLMRAEKVQKKVARVGFDWPDTEGPLDKVAEELAEVREALQHNNPEEIEKEIGDLLFAVVNLARKSKLDAELALQRATNKFIARFQKLETILAARNQKFEDLDLAALDAVWDEVKQQENREAP